MKTLFTICLWPMALIGVGIMACVSVELVRLGWRIGQTTLERITDAYERWRS